MWAPAPFQSPLTGLGSRVAATSIVLGDAVEQPAGHPQLVGDLRRADGADLELPLAGHDLGVDARDVEAGGEAGVEVGLDDVTAEHLVGADAAVVAALRGGEAALREPVGAALLEEVVLLLDAEDRLLVLVLVGDRDAGGAGVARVRRHVDVEDLAEHEDVVATTDGVGAREHGLQDAVGLVAGSLVRAGAVEAPDGQLGAVGEDLRLRPQLGRRLVPSIQMYSALYVIGGGSSGRAHAGVVCLSSYRSGTLSAGRFRPVAPL